MSNGNGKRLRELLESYGADRSRWPEGDRVPVSDVTSRLEVEARTIDQILDLATVPAPAVGAIERLLADLDSSNSPEAERVVHFRPKPPVQRQPFFRYAAVPLAASLALGVYLGGQGALDFALPESLIGAMAQTEDPGDDLGGVGEADAYFSEGLT